MAYEDKERFGDVEKGRCGEGEKGRFGEGEMWRRGWVSFANHLSQGFGG
jgi:hypothetical protein